MFMLYGIAEAMGWSGAITALTFGITLSSASAIGNRLFGTRVEEVFSLAEVSEVERGVFREVVFLLKTFFFLYLFRYLGISLQFGNLWVLAFGLVATVLVYVVRPLIVRWTVSRQTTKADASLMAIMVPKGLAAAVLASLPRQEGVALGDVIEGIVYSVIFFSLMFTAVLVFLQQRQPVRGMYRRVLRRFAEEESSDTAQDLQPGEVV
ncbi:hypothetical protein FJZ36_07310 [Candidatus Poribacteria bacterium]|nr:hypothetical protein [Candidatus Poribacteria bacterium]